MRTDGIRARLFEMRDEAYRAFQVKLIPTVEAAAVIGVRTPELKKLAKQLINDPETGSFLHALPHAYFDENQLHAFILSETKDFSACVEEVERFLPFIDNWATCDQLLPKAFKKQPAKLIEHIRRWIRSDKPYTVRFAIGLLMQHFLDERFDSAYPALVANVRSDEYYVRMMVAWYFATALAKQYESALGFIESGQLDRWTHNKAIQKVIESRRLTEEQKDLLRSLKR